ncbi:MAG: hypothetical protein MH321_11090 [Leptospiraceae bacterium]|nr:hypothetical protein [Leptospiraceae bacterium]
MNCASNRVQTTPYHNNYQFTKKKTLSFYVWGILPRYKYTFEELCGDQYLHSFEFQRDALSVITFMFTLGMYSTGNIIYSCYEEEEKKK